MKVNWLEASEYERRQLYAATRDIGAALNMSVEQVIDAALGRQAPIGTDYVANFRKGKIRRAFAKVIFEWIESNHSDLGFKFAPDLFQSTSPQSWNDYLNEHAITGKFRIATFGKERLNLIKPVTVNPKPELELKLGQEFCFHIDSNTGGHAVVLQEYKGQWHAMPIGADGSSVMHINAGGCYFPCDQDGRLFRLSETEDLGHHRIVVAISKNAEDLPTPDTPPNIEQDITVHSLKVGFSA